MQKKRKDEKFRVEEKDKDNRARKLTREDNKIKAKERDKKRLVRENIEFRANEREKDCTARNLTREQFQLTVEIWEYFFHFLVI
jgi:hypothetical protein